MQWLRPAFAFLLVALVYFYRIDRPLLWPDEADTGLAARTILRHGYPAACDGRNVYIEENGHILNKNLVFCVSPWIQFYLGAASLFLFGNNTLGLRILFVVCGVLSFFPIYAIVRTRLHYPSVLAGLILVSPQILLFQRNARYYPLLILLYAMLVWHLLRNFKSPRNRFLSAMLIFILLFHTHSFAAMCASISLIVFCLFFRREVLASYFFACGIGFASWLIWHQALGPRLAPAELFISIAKTGFTLWFKMFCISLWATIVDMDAVDCFPILLWVLILAVLLIRGGDALRNLFRDRLYAFVFLNIVIQVVAGAALFGFETNSHHSFFRYAPHLLVFALLALFMTLNTAVSDRKVRLFVCIFAVVFNFLTISFWTKPLGRRVPASWLLPVYSDIFRPPENAWDVVVSRMDSESKIAPGRATVMASLPSWTGEDAIFYLGDRYLIYPLLHAPAVECEQSIRKVMGEQAFNNLFQQPEWIVDCLEGLKPGPAGYELVDVIPSYQKNPDDGGRPELTRHSFPQPIVVRGVRLFRLTKK